MPHALQKCDAHRLRNDLGSGLQNSSVELRHRRYDALYFVPTRVAAGENNPSLVQQMLLYFPTLIGPW
jgi:hypothetical protein